MFVTPEEIGPVIGKKGVHLREIEQKTGVSKFVLVEDPSMLSPPYFETVGTRKGVETAKRLFNMHRYIQPHTNLRFCLSPYPFRPTDLQEEKSEMVTVSPYFFLYVQRIPGEESTD